MKFPFPHRWSALPQAPRRRLGIVVLSATACLLVAVLLATAVGGSLAPMARSRLIAVLQNELQSPVEVGTVHTRYHLGLQVDVDNLQAQSVLRGIPGDPAHPMLRVAHLHLRVGLLGALLGRISIADAEARGVQADLPPAGPTATQEPTGPAATFHLSHLTVDDAHIAFATGDPNRAALQFDIPHAELDRHGNAFRYQATVDTGDPIGSVDTAGTVGPWNLQDPRATPLQGSFAFDRRSVATVRGLLGTPSLRATYRGTLANLEAIGTVEDPAFGLDVSATPVALHSTFTLLIDAVHGEVRIASIDSHFLRTRFLLNGTIVKNPQPAGYVLDLTLHVPEGRIEDALLLGAHTHPTLLRGALRMDGRLQMPAGQTAVAQKLLLSDATFRLDSAQFGNPTVQRDADSLSERAKGHPKAAHPDTASPASATAAGRVSAANGSVHLSNVQVVAPGAQIVLAGSYALGGAAFRMNGTVHTDAEASHLNTGLKSLLTRPFNGLFAHGHPGATFPLEVTGSGNTPHFRIGLPGGPTISATH